jgi:hypothetical protein
MCLPPFKLSATFSSPEPSDVIGIADKALKQWSIFLLTCSKNDCLM